MGIRKYRAHSGAELVEISDAHIRRARAVGGAVELIVPDEAWATRRKLMLARTASLGVSVQSYPHWLEAAWDLYGDGRAIVSALQRRTMLRPLLRDAALLDSAPSAELVQELAAFVEQASIPNLTPVCSLTETEDKLMEVVVLYEQRLEREGLIEPARVASLLPMDPLTACAYVFEEPSVSCVHEWRFIERLGACADVAIVEAALPEGGQAEGDELACLRSRLFTGAGGLEATGRVHVGESAGAHATPALLVQMIQELVRAGTRPADIFVAFADSQSAYPHVHEALARAGIPFVSTFSLALMRTGLGAAACNLSVFASNPLDEAGYEPLCSFLLSPYSGISSDAGCALQERWRARAGSTAAERLADMRQGFNEGSSTSAQVRESLQPVIELLEADDAARIRLMFEHARAAHLDEVQLLDDRAAAEAALDYLEACAAVGAPPDVDELMSLPVSLERAFGPSEDAATLTDIRSFGLAQVPHVILADLNAETFPMAKKQRTFDALAEKLGIGIDDETAFQQRLMLLRLLEAAQESFGFYRSRTTTEGDESRQSALWDELMSVYRAPADDEAELPLHEPPRTLAAYTVRTSEADLFFRGQECETRPVRRGALQRDGAAELLVRNADGSAREFSPTQLEDYYRCPYRWFTTRRTGYNPLDRAFDQSALGMLFHDTMARFYPLLKAAGHARVTPENLPVALEAVDRAFDAQVAESMRRPQKGLFVRTQLDRLHVEDLRAKLHAFVERDAVFLPGFTPEFFEVRLGGGGALEYATVPVRGSVDRIDVDGRGNAVIIDYKLSTLRQDYGLGKDLTEHDLNLHVQADIYATLVQRHFELAGQRVNVVGSVYRSYTDNTLRGVYAKDIDWGGAEDVKPSCDGLPRDEYPGGYQQYLGRVEETMTQRMERLAAGDIAPAPIAKGVCAYCKALPFCPKGETNAAH